MPDVQMINLPVVLSKKLDGVIYNLMARTITENVYHGDYTLSEVLTMISNTFTTKADEKDVTAIQKKLRAFFKDAPEDYQSIVDILNYVKTCEDEIASMNIILGNKVDEADFQSANKRLVALIQSVKDDLTNEINGMVSGEVFEQRLRQLEAELRRDMYKNIITKSGDIPPEDLSENGYWIHVVD